MTSWTDEQLVLLYYRELAPDLVSKLNSELASSEELSERYRALTETLNAIEIPVPELDDNFEQRIIDNIESAGSQSNVVLLGTANEATTDSADDSATVTGREERDLSGSNAGVGDDLEQAHSDNTVVTVESRYLRPLLAAAAVLVLVISGFYAGRFSTTMNPDEDSSNQVQVATNSSEPQATTSTSAVSGERIFDNRAQKRLLRARVGSHLERSDRLLTAVSNFEPGAATSSTERLDELLELNRLYRFSAEKAGDHHTASLLEDLELILVELRNAPATDDDSMKRINERMESNDLLFKVRFASHQYESNNI